MHRLFDPVIDRSAGLGAGLDWKTSLQELTASGFLGVPEYHVEESGPDHQKFFRATVRVGGRAYGSGSGRSKKEAEQQAAEAAWKAISNGTESAAETAPGRPAGMARRGWPGGERPGGEWPGGERPGGDSPAADGPAGTARRGARAGDRPGRGDGAGAAPGDGQARHPAPGPGAATAAGRRGRRRRDRSSGGPCIRSPRPPGDEPAGD